MNIKVLHLRFLINNQVLILFGARGAILPLKFKLTKHFYRHEIIMVCARPTRPQRICRYLICVTISVLLIFETSERFRLHQSKSLVQDANKPSQTGCLLDWNPFHIDIGSYEITRRRSTATQNSVNDYRRPDVTLSGRKFLLPLLHFGPNNQLMGLRESVFVAMYLNRTIVIPMFLKHRTDT